MGECRDPADLTFILEGRGRARKEKQNRDSKTTLYLNPFPKAKIKRGGNCRGIREKKKGKNGGSSESTRQAKGKKAGTRKVSQEELFFH